ncbi:hypothetical protein M011DRAFT_467179 [Sporormia fimetaria CBS 119925]|uniref:Sterol regulatory element-binding protein cleavage-activating protein n=1 Tax=Sporormia fimetaria CBS 119925 TaxID=1340428 RepID=A0A6A6VC54_9PLEO|nr:hypothetical protein M011DRAFT_467179 [Sporormia fimetaria CBS 119925]
MIWYILYPFRGTTEPPRLSPSHPLRRAFQAHGTATARHWFLSILLTVVISVLLCYPALFQTDSPAAAGLRNLPKHVWTSTTEFEGAKSADVEVRQVWVHGDYMKALDRRVLREALHVQQALIRDGFGTDTWELSDTDNNPTPAPRDAGCLVPAAGRKWGYHSPMLYWNCSEHALDRDPDLLRTINSNSVAKSALNVTLRPSTVFAGKAFANKKLRAADALVLTLFDQTEASIGHAWDSRSRHLAQHMTPGWSMFPEDGQILKSRLYEFRFRPMSLSDDLVLGGSYVFVTLYVLWRMMHLRAVKSKSGLLITIAAKMMICVIASFTVCAYLGVDLARIPRPWFPGVVLCFGLGNIFRLINVVLETPPEMPPVQRIGHALGEVGHLSLAMAAQNLVLIYLCSRIVPPWVADFCIFAAVTLVLDFVFHLTFFVAVLSVDVQRMELQDSLARVDLKPAPKNSRQERQSWLAALRQGNLPVSTRFAGPVAIISLILAVNWHFFDAEAHQLTPQRFMERLRSRALRPPQPSLRDSAPINQARTPAEWLRLQDHNTARELFGFIKPNAHSFIARVYDPLLVVLDGAQGRDTAHRSKSLLERVQHFGHEHAFPAALIVVFLIAGVTLLMNYLLWTGLPDEGVEHEEEHETSLSVKTLPMPQTLDVVALASCPKGHIASVSLDRSTCLWTHARDNGFTRRAMHTATMEPKLWPLVGCTIDESGRLMALIADSGRIGLWSISAGRFVLFPTIALRSQVPVLFTFMSTQNGNEQNKLSLVIVSPDGRLTVVGTRTGEHQTKCVTTDQILSATLYTCVKGATSVVYASKSGEVYILPLFGDEWTPEVVAGLDPGPPPGSNPYKIRSIHGAPYLGLIFAIRTEEVEVFGFHTRALVHTLKVSPVKPSTFRVMHSTRRLCSCGAPAVRTLAIAYTTQGVDRMMMHTFTFEGANSLICLGKPGETAVHSCKSLQKATERKHYAEPAGVWEVTNTQSIAGVRRPAPPCTPQSNSSSDSEDDYISARAIVPASALKAKEHQSPDASSCNRPSKQARRESSSSDDDDGTEADTWEAWTLSSTGEFRTRPLLDDNDASLDQVHQQLFVASPGPAARVGNKSVALGFGNTVKIISLGKESFFEGRSEPLADRCEDGDLLGMGVGVGSYQWRARKGGAGRKVQ